MNLHKKRKTKIIWSFDSGQLNPDSADKATRWDIDGLKIKYGSADVENTVSYIKSFRDFSKKRKKYIPIILDVEFNHGHVDQVNSDYLQQGSEVKIGIGQGDIKVSFPYWDKIVKPGMVILCDYGAVKLQVKELKDSYALATILQEGPIARGSDILIADLEEGVILQLFKQNINHINRIESDCLVISGLHELASINVVKELTSAGRKSRPWYLIKVDSGLVYENLTTLIDEADGIFLSRKDLSIAYNPASVPMACKEIIKLSQQKAKFTIIASDMLASMHHNPTPTRAEVSDIANAIIDGTDAVVLSEDVNLGHHQERAIALCNSLIDDLEEKTPMGLNWQKGELPIENEFDAVAYHAVQTSERINAHAIVCITFEGNTAKRLASFRVNRAVIAVTFDQEIFRKLFLVRGVTPILLEINPEIDQVLPTVNAKLLEKQWLKKGDKIVFVTVSLSPVGEKLSNLFTIQTLS